MGNFELAEAMVEFAAGSQANWNNFELAIPNNVIVYTTDTQIFKRGDGIHRFSELTDVVSIAGVTAGSEALVNVLVNLVAGDEGKIIYIDNEEYKASGTQLADVLSRIATIAAKDIEQNNNLDTITSQSSLVGAVSGADNGKLVISMNHKMVPGVLPESIVVLTPPSPLHIVDQGIYDNLQLDSIPVFLYPNTTYYYKINACHKTIDVDSLSFALTSDLVNAVITNLGRGLFKVAVGAVQYNTTVKFDASVTYSAAVAARTASKVILGTDGSGWPSTPSLLTCVYGGSAYDYFIALAVDSNNNIICVGATSSEGTGSPTYNSAFIVKYDKDLNILARKVYSGASYDTFTGVAIDSSNNIFCCGNTQSDGVGSPTTTNAIVIKFDSNLNILARKVSQGAYQEFFYGICIDSLNNVICCGYNTTEGVSNPNSWSCYLVKFNNSLSVLSRIVYSGTGEDVFFSVVTDSSNNIICAGYTSSENTGNSQTLVVKFDSSLNILAKKRFANTYSNEQFYGIAVDSSNNVFCCGLTQKAVTSDNEALIVKFDNSLNVLARKIYSGISPDSFQSVAVDSDNNVICVGYTNSEGAGIPTYQNALVVKLDNQLNTLAKKIYGGAANSENFAKVTVDSDNNIICVGYTLTEGASPGIHDALILKLESNIPLGTYVGAVLTNLTLSDSNIALIDSPLTLVDSTITYAVSAVTFGDSALTLTNSALASEWDDFATGGFIYRDILAVVYGGTYEDVFASVAIDSDENLICVGTTNSEGVGTPTLKNALIVKFDANLNILARKIYGGSNTDGFSDVDIDSNNNIICVGYTVSEGLGSSTLNTALVVKFDPNLNILVRKIYGGIYDDAFSGVAIDSSDNIICVGSTSSEGTVGMYYNALIVKFDTNLSVLVRKMYGGTIASSTELFYQVTIDSNGNVIAVGIEREDFESEQRKALIVKFDTNLTILAKKVYGGLNTTYFGDISVDSNDNIICVGYTNSEGIGSPTFNNALIIKFDNNLNILIRKIYGGSNTDSFRSVAVDSNNNIICVGSDSSEGLGSPTYANALVVKFDTNLNILARKIYSGTLTEAFTSVITDNNDDIILVGRSESYGAGMSDGLLLKLPKVIPSGTFQGGIIGLTFSDSNLTLADSTLTFADSTLPIGVSTLTLSNSALTLTNSTLTLAKDLIQL